MTIGVTDLLEMVIAALALVVVGLVAALWVGRRDLGQIRVQAGKLKRTVGLRAAQIDDLTADRSRLVADQAAVSTTAAILEVELVAGRKALGEAQVARDLARTEGDRLQDQLDAARATIARLELAAVEVEPVRAELGRVSTQQRALGGRLEALTRLKQEADADRTRLTLQVATLEQQVRGALDVGTEDRQKQDGTRMLLAAQVQDLRHRLEEAKNTGAGLEASLAQSAEREGSALQGVKAAEARFREARLAHQAEAAAMSAAAGAVAAQVERLEPLKRQLADREELIRALATERNEALQLAGTLEADLVAALAERDALMAETARSRDRVRSAAARAAEAESAAASAGRQRDDLAAGAQRANARLESLTTEIRERDVRFQTLLEDRAAAVAAREEEIHHLRDQIRRARAPEPPAENGRNGTPAAGSPTDDLQRIAGIGPALEKQLHARGVRTFRQLSEWTPADVARFAAEMGSLRGRIERDRWVEQARGLASSASDSQPFADSFGS